MYFSFLNSFIFLSLFLATCLFACIVIFPLYIVNAKILFILLRSVVLSFLVFFWLVLFCFKEGITFQRKTTLTAFVIQQKISGNYLKKIYNNNIVIIVIIKNMRSFVYLFVVVFMSFTKSFTQNHGFVLNFVFLYFYFLCDKNKIYSFVWDLFFSLLKINLV